MVDENMVKSPDGPTKSPRTGPPEAFQVAVRQARAELIALGERPSISKVRQRLGKGDRAWILTVLQAANAEDAGPERIEPLVMRDARRLAPPLVDAIYTAVREELAADLAAQRVRSDRAEALAHEAEYIVEDLSSTNEELRNHLVTVRAHAAEERMRSGEATAVLESHLQDLVRQVEEAHGQVANLTHEVANVRMEGIERFEAERLQRTEVEKEVISLSAHHAAEAFIAASEIESLRRRCAAEETARVTAQAEIADLLEKLRQSREQADHAMVTAQSANSEVSALRHLLERLGEATKPQLEILATQVGGLAQRLTRVLTNQKAMRGRLVSVECARKTAG